MGFSECLERGGIAERTSASKSSHSISWEARPNPGKPVQIPGPFHSWVT